MLSQFGIDASTVDPRTIKIYNNGGYMLPKGQSAKRPEDLIENAIFIKGQNDGKFDENDYILFYARGTSFWEYDSVRKQIVRRKHYYSKVNYYWITSGGNPGKRMKIQKSLNIADAYKQTDTKAFAFRDDDKVNLLKSGVIYVGDEFSVSTKSRTYITPLPNILPDSKINFNFQIINYSSKTVPLSLYENGKLIYSGNMMGASGFYSVAGVNHKTASYTGTLSNDRSVLKFIFNTINTSVNGYLDYYEIRYLQKLKANDDNLTFFSKDTNAVIEYDLSNFSNSLIEAFNVTDFANVKLLSPLLISGGDYKFQANGIESNSSKYIALTENKFLTPPSGQKVENSNLHGNIDGAEYIIITNKIFKDQAEKLRQYRQYEAPKKITATIVYMSQIYDEFSSGLLDPVAIRDFIRYAYLNWHIKPFYVLLFGDGDYDYLDTEGQGKNYIPAYETMSSFNDVYSYPYDDFYARIVGNDETDDVAIGRLPVRTSEDADVIVNKIIEYETKAKKGLWRNKITLLADDGLTSTGNDWNLHQAQSEQLSRYHIPPYFNQDKIYLAAYPAVNTGLGRRKPAVNVALLKAMNDGTLILNFIGHGNPNVWTHEVVFDKNTTIPQLRNKQYFFLTAATCDFGRYDDPMLQSGTEEMLLLNGAGIIGGISASRPVVSYANAALTYTFYDHLLGYRDSTYLPPTIGEAYFEMKQNRTGANDEKYHLFGDPGLRLDEPRLKVKIDSVNGSYLGINIKLKALGVARIDGTVLKADSTVNTDISGQAILSVYDSERSIYLEEVRDSMRVQGGLLFKGRVSIENGNFSTSFRVPKDISYENRHGKIVAYFMNQNTDGIGYTKNITVGGSDTTAVNDKQGPKIQIFFDNTAFKNSYLVSPNFDLIIKLSDQTGLNTTGTGVGHKLEGILNGNESNPIDFTNYFVGNLNAGGKSGVINYKFNDLSQGNYKLKVKAWDVFNNYSSDVAYFSVVNKSGLVIRDVFNYPNPFAYKTTFTFQQNLASPINVKIKIYTIAGRLIKVIQEDSIFEKFVKVNWDGRDEDGNSIANGTYLYKLIVETVNGKFNRTFLGKLSIIK